MIAQPCACMHATATSASALYNSTCSTPRWVSASARLAAANNGLGIAKSRCLCQFRQFGQLESLKIVITTCGHDIQKY